MAPPDKVSIVGNTFGDGAWINTGDIYQYNNASDPDLCLKDLHATDPRHDKTRIQDAKGGLLQDSYRWILGHDDFKQWRHGDSRLLWIKGDPGKGKTMLLCGIIDELTPATKLANTDADILLAYFFCQATDPRIDNAIAVLRGLIYMLADQQPALLKHVRREYDRRGRTLFEDANAWVALSGIFTSMMQDPSIQTAYLLIDALDECMTGRPQLLDFIVSKSAAFSRVKWVVASRNWPEIQEHLDTATQKLSLCLELNAASISAAMGKYVDHKVDQLAQLKKYDQNTRHAVHRHLSSNADDTFLWVALVCQHLRTVPKWKVLGELHTFPSGLDSLYQRMMDRIRDSSDADLCKKILAVVSATFRPITIHELGCFVETLRDICDNESLAYIVGLCGSFLTIREHTVYFVHQSAKDFLLKSALDEIMPSGLELHHKIFSVSLDVMSRTLRRDIYNLHRPGFPIDQVKRPEPDPLAKAQYSCVYWVDHLQACRGLAARDVQDGGSIDSFLRCKYLYWLEALSLLKNMSQGVLAMEKLDKLLPDPNSQLASLIHDQRRFIQYHKPAIENSPLQTYASALVFSPHLSITRELFKHEEPDWVATKPITEDSWSACLQTSEGHTDWVNSVVFSPDGQLLASASSDEAIKLWDRTGACAQTFEGHTDWVNSVVFSPDSQLLASASLDQTIKLWDRTGACVETFEGHTGPVYSVVFSSDGQLLASASLDQTIKLWDRTGACVETFEGHTSSVNSVVFSPDGQLLASASGDKTIKLWDRTGACVQTFEGHTGWVNSVMFSPDGQLLASASSDEAIKLWDRTGACAQTFEGHTGPVYSVVFSSDGQLLASASLDQTIKLWDRTGACVQTLNIGQTIYHLVFDSNSKFIHTEIGTFILSPTQTPGHQLREPPQQKLQRHGYGLNSESTWILYNTERILWLPPDYRPGSSAVAGSNVAIGCRSGRVIPLQFSQEGMY